MNGYENQPADNDDNAFTGEAEPVAAAASADSESVQKFLGLVEQMNQQVQNLQRRLSGEALLNELIGALSCHPPFVVMIRGLVKETVAEIIADREHAHDHGEAPPDAEGVIGYQVEITEAPQKLQACLTGSDHPTNPNGVEVFFNNGTDEAADWEAIRFSDMAVAEIRNALVNVAAQPYQHRWVSLQAIGTGPISRLSEPEKVDNES